MSKTAYTRLCAMIYILAAPLKGSAASYHWPQVEAGPSTIYASQAMPYLGRCYKWTNIKGCMEAQDKFIRQYVNALAGDYEAQHDVASAFTDGQNDDDLKGGPVIPNKLQACAWRQVIAASGSPYLTSNDQSAMVSDCDDLRPMDVQAAKGRAHAIVHVITTAHVHPVAVPEIEYDPKSGKDETQAD